MSEKSKERTEVKHLVGVRYPNGVEYWESPWGYNDYATSHDREKEEARYEKNLNSNNVRLTPDLALVWLERTVTIHYSEAKELVNA